jgi:hypothetical protein
MHQFEQLGLFYLGKRFDVTKRTRLDDTILYDSKDLVTHAVCVGMTGSGKTGLGIAMIEEAALDGVPVLAIDPKGDLSNLLLTFPSLSADEFAPWVEATDPAASAQQANQWQKGLADWDEDGDRIGRFRAAANAIVFTPGSRAGTPLALLKTLVAGHDEDDEDAAARVGSTAESLLALAGFGEVDAQSRERTLIATILAKAKPGDPGDLPWLIQQIQRPSFDRIGVLDLETFFPAKDRQALALQFNSVLAAPGFDVWLEGAPLDPARLLYTDEGKPRVAIVSIAHLGDAERMLVVSLLLNALVEWTRKQRGTASLRALVYMDEVFGYLPPVANPPSKAPLLTLLKQARAFGVGVMLATQNPVDLDYKALSNTGTWFLGKLQTERDKARVLDGLEGIGMDRALLDTTLSALPGRVFLMHDVHEHGPVTFETRWTLSYLRGPMSREELKRLRTPTANSSKPDPDSGSTPNSQERGPNSQPRETETAEKVAVKATSKPVIPSGIIEVFVPAGGTATYRPMLYGSARVRYTDAKRGIDSVGDVNAIVSFGNGPVPVSWDGATEAPVGPDQLSTTAPAGGTFTAPPSAALDPKRYAAWTRDFEEWIARSKPLRVFTAPDLQLTSTAGEGEREFRLRAQHAAREARDAQVEKLRGSYAAKVARATEKVRKAQESVGKEEQQVGQQRLQTAVSVGATLVGALLGRRAISATTLGRATTAARGVGRSLKEGEDVTRAQDRLTQAQQELTELQQAVEAAVTAVSGTTEPAIETTEIAAKRGGIDTRLVALAWLPAF